MVQVGNIFKVVKIKGRVVTFLLNLNANRRNDISVDLPFIKALLISVFGVKIIRAGGELEQQLIDFIEGKKIHFFSENCQCSIHKLLSHRFVYCPY